MPKKLRIMSGREVIKILERYGGQVSRTVGSHVRITIANQHITVPLHKTLKKGTLRTIVKSFEVYFGVENTTKEFYTGS